MDIIKVLAAYARWHVRVKAFSRGEATWVQVLMAHHQVQEGLRWLNDALHLRHCPEWDELSRTMPAAELAIATLMGDLDRGQLSRAEIKLTIGSTFYRTVGRFKIALHALHQAVEEPMGLRAPVAGRPARRTTLRPTFPTVAAS